MCSCKEYQNLNAFFAVVMGLSNNACSRLIQSWDKVPSKFKKWVYASKLIVKLQISTNHWLCVCMCLCFSALKIAGYLWNSKRWSIQVEIIVHTGRWKYTHNAYVYSLYSFVWTKNVSFIIIQFQFQVLSSRCIFIALSLSVSYLNRNRSILINIFRHILCTKLPIKCF